MVLGGGMYPPDATRLRAEVVALTLDGIDLDDLGGWGADRVVAFTGIAVANEEDTAAAQFRVVAPARGKLGWTALLVRVADADQLADLPGVPTPR